MHKPGYFLDGTTSIVVLKEKDTKHYKDDDVNYQKSIVLCIVPEKHDPFVTWDRLVSWVDDAPHDQVATNVMGHYFDSIEAALEDFNLRVRSYKNEEALKQRGKSDGEAAASWIVDGNTEDPAGVLKKLLDGISEGDPEIMDSLPQPRLSGEWADDPTWTDILRDECDEDTTEDEKEDDTEWQIAYEDAFHEGVEAALRMMYKSYSGADYVGLDRT